MASNAYVKSLIWVVSFGGIGYGLMQLTTPSAEKIERIKSTGRPLQETDEEKQKLLMLKRLQEAAHAPAIYAQPPKKA